MGRHPAPSSRATLSLLERPPRAWARGGYSSRLGSAALLRSSRGSVLTALRSPPRPALPFTLLLVLDPLLPSPPQPRRSASAGLSLAKEGLSSGRDLTPRLPPAGSRPLPLYGAGREERPTVATADAEEEARSSLGPPPPSPSALTPAPEPFLPPPSRVRAVTVPPSDPRLRNGGGDEEEEEDVEEVDGDDGGDGGGGGGPLQSEGWERASGPGLDSPSGRPSTSGAVSSAGAAKLEVGHSRGSAGRRRRRPPRFRLLPAHTRPLWRTARRCRVARRRGPCRRYRHARAAGTYSHRNPDHDPKWRRRTE